MQIAEYQQLQDLRTLQSVEEEEEKEACVKLNAVINDTTKKTNEK